jgi:hypothetical protein
MLNRVFFLLIIIFAYQSCNFENSSSELLLKESVERSDLYSQAKNNHVLENKEYWDENLQSQVGSMKDWGEWDVQESFPGEGYYQGLKNLPSTEDLCQGVSLLGVEGEKNCEEESEDDSYELTSLRGGASLTNITLTNELIKRVSVSSSSSSVESLVFELKENDYEDFTLICGKNCLRQDDRKIQVLVDQNQSAHFSLLKTKNFSISQTTKLYINSTKTLRQMDVQATAYNDLEFWVDAYDLSSTATHGDQVEITDKSNNYVFSNPDSSKRPYFIEDAYHQYPTLTFFGTQSIGNNLNNPSMSDFTLLLAMSVADHVENQKRFISFNSGGQDDDSHEDGLTVGTANLNYYIGIGRVIPSQASLSLQNTSRNKLFLLTIRFQASGLIEGSLNSSTMTQDAHTIATTFDPDFVLIGSSTSAVNTANFTGDISEIMFFHEALSDDDLSDIECYLLEKYDIEQLSECYDP